MKNPTQPQIYNEYSLEEQIRQECEAMAKYAFASGRAVPEALVESLQTLSTQESGETGETVDTSNKPRDTTKDQKTPDTTPPTGPPTSRARVLAQIHKQLVEIVAPATPRTILLLATESAKGGFFHFLGPVPLIRRMMLAAIIALASFILVSMSKDVNTVSITENVFVSSGMELLKVLLFLLSAAALGASFAGLFQANRYVAEGTFDPQYESSYWIRFVLGLMAGIMLAELIPVSTFGQASGAETSAVTDPKSSAAKGSELRFSVGAEFQGDLDSGKITEKLREAFEKQKILISTDVTVSIEEEGNKWLIYPASGKIALFFSAEIAYNLRELLAWN